MVLALGDLIAIVWKGHAFIRKMTQSIIIILVTLLRDFVHTDVHVKTIHRVILVYVIQGTRP